METTQERLLSVDDIFESIKGQLGDFFEQLSAQDIQNLKALVAFLVSMAVFSPNGQAQGSILEFTGGYGGGAGVATETTGERESQSFGTFSLGAFTALPDIKMKGRRTINPKKTYLGIKAKSHFGKDPVHSVMGGLKFGANYINCDGWGVAMSLMGGQAWQKQLLHTPEGKEMTKIVKSGVLEVLVSPMKANIDGKPIFAINLGLDVFFNNDITVNPVFNATVTVPFAFKKQILEQITIPKLFGRKKAKEAKKRRAEREKVTLERIKAGERKDWITPPIPTKKFNVQKRQHRA